MPNTARLASYFQALVEGTRQDFRDQCESVLFKTSEVADGASAVAHYLDSPAYTTPGAKLLSVRNAGVEKFSVGYDGKIAATSLAIVSDVYPTAGPHVIRWNGAYGEIRAGYGDGNSYSVLRWDVFNVFVDATLMQVRGLIFATDNIDDLGAAGGTSARTIYASSSFIVNPRTVTASAPVFQGTQTWNNGAVTFKALTIDITDTASAAGYFAMFAKNGDYQAYITKDGQFFGQSGYYMGSTGSIIWSSRALISASAVNELTFSGASGYANLIAGAPTFQANALVANFIAPSANVFMRLADSATSGTRKEFTTLLDTTANAVTMTAVQQGVGYMPIYFEGSKVCLNAGTGGNVGIGTTNPTFLLTLSIGGLTRQTTPGIDFFGTVLNGVDTTAYRSGRIYGKFEGDTYAGARLTLASLDVNGTPVDTLTVRDSKVGIGTTSPTELLDLGTSGGIAVRGSATNSVGASNTGGLFISYNQNPVYGARIEAVHSGSTGKPLTLAGYPLRFASSHSGLEFARMDDGGYWTLEPVFNAGATTFTAFKVNVTDTASASGSLLMDLQVGGTSLVSARKDGKVFATDFGLNVATAGASADSWYRIGHGYNSWVIRSYNQDIADFSGQVGRVTIQSGFLYAWSASSSISGATVDTALGRNAAGVVEVNNGTAGTYRDLILRNLFAGDGSAANPSISFSGYTSTGIYTAGNALRFTSNGTQFMLGTANDLQLLVDFVHTGAKIGFFSATAIVKPTGVAVSAAGIHAALVSLGLIGA